jgi:hypothetical protein
VLSNIVFIDNDNVIKICVAWKALKHDTKAGVHYGDPTADVRTLANLTGLAEEWVGREIARLMALGILLPECKIDEDVERYIDTIVAGRARAAQAGKEANK